MAGGEALVVEKVRHRPGQEPERVFYACGPVRESLAEARRDLDTLRQEFGECWSHSCDAICGRVQLWVIRCQHCGRPRTEPTP